MSKLYRRNIKTGNAMSDEYEYEEYDDIEPRSDEEQMYDDDCRERAEDMREELK